LTALAQEDLDALQIHSLDLRKRLLCASRRLRELIASSAVSSGALDLTVDANDDEDEDADSSVLGAVAVDDDTDDVPSASGRSLSMDSWNSAQSVTLHSERANETGVAVPNVDLVAEHSATVSSNPTNAQPGAQLHVFAPPLPPRPSRSRPSMDVSNLGVMASEKTAQMQPAAAPLKSSGLPTSSSASAFRTQFPAASQQPQHSPGGAPPPLSARPAVSAPSPAVLAALGASVAAQSSSPSTPGANSRLSTAVPSASMTTSTATLMAPPPAQSQPLSSASLAAVAEIKAQQKCGFLTKSGGANNNRGWNRRWCTFSDGIMRYFKSSKDPEPAGLVSLHIMMSVHVASDTEDDHDVPADEKRPYVFHLTTSRGRVYQFAADSRPEMRDWVEVLGRVIAARAVWMQAFPAGGALANPAKLGPVAYGGAQLMSDRKRHLIASWPQRFLLVKGSTIALFKEMDDVTICAPLFTIPSHLASAKYDKNRVMIDTNKWRFVFKCPSVDEAATWWRAICDAIQQGFNELSPVQEQTSAQGSRAVRPSIDASPQAPSTSSTADWASGGDGSQASAQLPPAVVSSAHSGSTGGGFGMPPGQSYTGMASQTPLASSSGATGVTTASAGVDTRLQASNDDVEGDDEMRVKFISGAEAYDAIRQNPANRQCADCRAPDPDWASINLGIPLCINCSGIHRALGTHRSKVRSITMDKWTAELVALLVAIGSDASNRFWEARIAGSPLKLSPTASAAERTDFIKAKYEMMAMCTKRIGVDADALGHELVDVCGTSDLMATVGLLASGAEVNYMDKMASNRSPLHVAAESGQVLQVQLLLLNGANPQLTDDGGYPPFYYSSVNQHGAICSLIEASLSRASEVCQ
jgi:hypothetical protein